MIEGKDRETILRFSCFDDGLHHLPVAGSDGCIANNGVEGGVAQGHQHLGLHKQDFLVQVRRKEGDLFLVRRTIGHAPLGADLGRADFDHIADADVRPVQLQHIQKLIQILACLAHKGAALQGFLLSGSLPDEHHHRMMLVAFSKDHCLFRPPFPGGFSAACPYIMHGHDSLHIDPDTAAVPSACPGGFAYPPMPLASYWDPGAGQRGDRWASSKPRSVQTIAHGHG